MPTEQEFINYKDFVESLDSVNPSANDKTVLNVGVTGPKSSVFSAIAAFVHNAWATFVNALTAKTSFASGDKIPVVNGSTATAMEASKLFELTAQNALAGNVAPAFDPTRDADHKYLAGESVAHEGKTYTFKVDHYGPWAAADVYQLDEEDLAELSLKKKMDVFCGKNLFNKNSSNKQAGCYVAYNVGRLVSLSGYSVYVIDVSENVELTFNKSNVQVAAFSGKILVNHEQVTAQDISGYIDGANLTDAGMTWTTPVGCKCIAVSVADANVDSFQVEEGDAVTPYKNYRTGISEDDVFGLSYDLAKKLDADCGKNLLNKDTPNKLSGYYVSYNTGSLIAVASYSAIIVEIGAGVELAFNQNSLHITAFSELFDIREQFAGNIPTYIDGYTTSAENRSWTTPVGCKCIVVSGPTSGINSLQVEKGSTPTSYEPYKTGIDSEKVFGLAEIKTSLEKKIDKKLDGVCGKNLFNANTPNKQTGCYVAYNIGRLVALESFSSYVIEIGAGVGLAFNKNNMHITAYSTDVDVSSASAGDINGYISGYLTSAGDRTWTTPAGTKCIIVSCATSDASSLQVEKGSSPTSYEPYVFGLQSSKLIGANVLVVGQGFEFSTIQSAVDAAQDGSTILIMPGVYNEAVKTVYQEKLLHLVGFDRNKCIITHPVNDYFNPPLEIAKGMVENLTFVVTGTELDNNGAYCVHIDFTQSIGQSLQFVNCAFKGTVTPCVGIGLRENFTLSFVGCSFENYAKNGPIYCHEQQDNNKTGQRIEVVDCSILNSATDAIRPAVTLQESTSYTGNEATILLQRNIMKCKYGDYTQAHDAIWCKDHSTNEPTSGGGKYLDSHIWELDFMSEMNSESIANYSEQ